MKSDFAQSERGKPEEDWSPVRLGDVVDLLTGFPFKSEHYVEDSNAPRLLRGDNVAQGTLRWDGAKRLPMSAVKDVVDYSLREGDVILAMDRPWIDAGLKYASVRSSDLPSLLVQRVARLRGRDRLDTRFLKYVIASKAFTNYILSVQTGTAVPHISADQIKSFEFLLPSLQEQRVIADILGALDDKTDLNNRINKTLEAIGRAIFKHWLIDFEFPNDEGKPYKSSGGKMVYNEEFGQDIPKAWKAKPIDEIADFLNGLALQNYPPKGKEKLPVIKIRELRQGISESTDNASSNLPKQYIVDNGDILFSWSGSLEVVIWTSGVGALNQHLFKVTSKDYPKWFYYHWILQHLPEYRRIAEGKATTMGHIQRHHLKNSLVLVPDQATLQTMDRIQSPIIEKLIWIGLESRSLSQLRDMLLPKLMSGKIRAPVEVR